MPWEVEATDEFGSWYLDLAQAEQSAINAVVDLLDERGPALGRPYADTIAGSRHANMKELRPPEGNIRILFAFDPRRMAILLLGGDKTNEWVAWYRRMIPVADGMYDEHLEDLRREGLLP
ncbi:MAG TPA: type II toxin-antitoxin system RelE/ParE family toxin [Chloroflexota bacterium]|nr:type II toxin-antitoxin system RelE/ParE family toxin [Chloroflexota bacterium]